MDNLLVGALADLLLDWIMWKLHKLRNRGMGNLLDGALADLLLDQASENAHTEKMLDLDMWNLHKLLDEMRIRPQNLWHLGKNLGKLDIPRNRRRNRDLDNLLDGALADLLLGRFWVRSWGKILSLDNPLNRRRNRDLDNLLEGALADLLLEKDSWDIHKFLDDLRHRPLQNLWRCV